MFSFLKKIFFSTLLLIAIGIFPYLSFGQDFHFEIACAVLISVINAVVGYYLVLKAINKSEVEFYKFVYGGMMVRMVIVFGFSIYMITSDIVLMIPYMLFFILFYVLHQWIEIFGWLKELPKQKIQFNS